MSTGAYLVAQKCKHNNGKNTKKSFDLLKIDGILKFLPLSLFHMVHNFSLFSLVKKDRDDKIPI